jgi:hypothetical protein
MAPTTSPSSVTTKALSARTNWSATSSSRKLHERMAASGSFRIASKATHVVLPAGPQRDSLTGQDHAEKRIQHTEVAASVGWLRRPGGRITWFEVSGVRTAWDSEGGAERPSLEFDGRFAA